MLFILNNENNQILFKDYMIRNLMDLLKTDCILFLNIYDFNMYLPWQNKQNLAQFSTAQCRFSVQICSPYDAQFVSRSSHLT